MQDNNMIHRIYTGMAATVLLAATLLPAGCSKELGGGSEPSAPGEPTPIGVRVEVAQPTRSVVTGTEFAHGSQINIILHDAGATDKYKGISMPYEFQKLTADPGVWLPTATEGLLVSDLANVYAHAPSQLPSFAVLDAGKNNIDVTLPAALDLGDISGSLFESFYMKLRSTDTAPTEIFVSRDEADLMIGQGTQVTTATGGTKETTIAMKHALAMIVIYVKRATELVSNPKVQSVDIHNIATAAKPLKQGSFSLADNSFTPNSTEASYKRTMSGFPIDKVHYALLVNPATMAASEVEMVITDDQGSYPMKMPAKTWEPGKVYIYNVTISANEAQIDNVLLADWPAWTENSFDLE